MMKQATLLFVSLLCSLVSFAAITGPSVICTGTPANYIDSGAVTGGTWSSSNTAVAVISSSAGISVVVSGVSAGTAIISYVVGSTVDTKIVTVSPGPAPIVGGGVTICPSATITLTDATPGGVWSVSGSSAIGSSTGILTAGTYTSVDTVYYTIGSCSVSTLITVAAADSITGLSTVCVGSTVTLSAMASGGTWSSSNPAVATVSSGVVTGVSGGSAIISHTTSASCGTFVATHLITVTTTVSPITGPSSIGVGATGFLLDSTFGGVWSSSNPSVATITSYGAVTGIAAGTTIISYAVAGCGPTAFATYIVTVSAFNGISGYIHYTGSGAAKVWLIKYNTSAMMLYAVDSTWASGTDSAYYQFLGLSTDSFRVKASLDSGASLGSFVPTYHTSNFYWNAATVIHHTSGMWDTHKDINLISGASTAGPGFIGGSILTGANKGTADGAPAVNLSVYLVNATTNAVVKYTTTDASGNYAFSGLSLDTYYVFPEALSYVTIPYTGITLTSSSASMSTAKFVQRTISKKIQPVMVGVDNIGATNTAIVAFPNPTNGKLNISWDAATTEAATLVITDVTGREVLTKEFSMTKGNGAHDVDLSSFANGMYFVSVKSANTMYVSKIEVRH